MMASEPLRLHVGTYSKAGGLGLTTVRGGTNWEVEGAYDGARNASFGIYSARFGLHYFVNEQTDGAIGAYRDGSSGWEQMARLPTQGAEPCYVALNGHETLLAVANYASGSIALFTLDPETGMPRGPVAVAENHGSGPVPDRQDGPHAHCVSFSPDGLWLFHVDLGSDEVLAYPIDNDAGVLGDAVTAYRAPPGSGPRHLLFHPRRPIALLVSELAATLTMLDVAGDRLTARHIVSTAPEGFIASNLGGHLALNRAGDRVYVTNRGHDSIAVFALRDDGAPTLLQHIPSRGASPGFFLLLEAEALLVLANEEGNNLVAFEIAVDGTLRALSVNLMLPGAVFVTEARPYSDTIAKPRSLT
jgi:6-phosphogluconolactonase (cycloisomerase 2 family)